MGPEDPPVAQRVVSEYTAVLEKHASANLHPASITTLPYRKETIKAAIRTVVLTLRATGQLTPDLREFLEEAFTSLADYVDDELARLMLEYRRASADLASDGRRGVQQVDTPAWKIVAESGSLVASIARTIAAETEALRNEFGELLK